MDTQTTEKTLDTLMGAWDGEEIIVRRDQPTGATRRNVGERHEVVIAELERCSVAHGPAALDRHGDRPGVQAACRDPGRGPLDEVEQPQWDPRTEQ